MKKVLVTGGAGYVGSTLCNYLLDRNYQVKVIDKLSFGGESLLSIIKNPNFEFINGNICDVRLLDEQTNDVDVVVHLAAIVGDPACAKQPEIAEETNWVASKNLFDICARKTNVKRFIFASTCSNYGKMNGTDYVSETSPLTPVSLYARLKVKFEKYILESETRSDFLPVALRFATVYGLSQRMRFDLTVNEFTRDLFIDKKLVVFGEQFWRPYCHVTDIANACIKIIEANADSISHNVFNIGNTEENYTKKMLVDLISSYIPDCNVIYEHREEDPRDYKVNFEKVKNIIGFKNNYTVKDGIEETLKALRLGLFSDPFEKRYKNI